MNKMNVIFIMADQQRADTIGPNKIKYANYPNMEKLRQESVNFDNFYTASSPCVPSRHTFLTGRNAWTLGCDVNEKFSMGNELTWMQLLRDNGYRCVSVGKTHMVHAGSFHIQVPIGKTFGEQDGWNHFNPEKSPERDDFHFDINTAHRACETLERLEQIEPFAMFIGFHAPHEPYVLPEKYLDFCKTEDVDIPVNRSEREYENKSKAYRRRYDHFRNMFGEITDDMVKKGIAGYHCSLKMVDDCLGLIMEKLKNLDLLKNTLIIYTSDHGDLLGEHGIFNKAATAYESEIRIPFMIRFPDGYKAGCCVDALASSVDFVPTLLEILECNADISLPGYSLMPAVNNGEKLRDCVTTFSTGGAMSIRTSEYKLLYNAQDKDGELYDMIDDPIEMNNLYNNTEALELRRIMFEKMMHSRILDDIRNNTPTNRERRLHEEVWVSSEPEVVVNLPLKK